MSPLEDRARRRVGTVLGGKYLLERVLGAGGMAAVYEGVHRNGNRVAVKVLHLEASADPQTVTRFRREGYVANSIGHPGAVRVLDDDVDEEGSAFLVMELLAGETLYARAKRSEGSLPVREVLALARGLCDVLVAAHDKGVIHRDIKPENLFLTTDRVLKVLDFGIARMSEGGDGRATNAGAALGTPAFMPPEQALGHSREVDARSDVWSVGATMFSLLSGQLVHEAHTATELLIAAATRAARSLGTVAPGVPMAVVAVVDRALSFSPDERWPSAAALRDAIDEAHQDVFGGPVSVDHIGAVPHAPPPLSRPAAELFFAETKEAVAPSTSLLAASGVGASPLAATARVSTTARGPSSRGLSSRESAPTLPAADAPPQPRTTLPNPSGSVPPAPVGEKVGSGPSLPPPSRPAETLGEGARSGRFLAVVLALVAGVALVMARVRKPPVSTDLPPAGLAPCLTDADCVVAGWVCGPLSRCVQRAGCASNEGCTEEAGGRPSICRLGDRACVVLASEDCKVLAQPGDLENDSTLWIGAMFPRSGGDATLFGDASMRSVDLARRDFAETVSGLPPARPGGPRRPLAVVACDDAADPARAATHLVRDLHVPVILGFNRSKEVADLAASHFTPGGVLALACNTASMLRTIPRAPGQPRLVYRTTTSSDMMQAPSVALLAEAVEPEIRAQPGVLAPGEPIRVALVRIANASGLGLVDGYVSALRFNGKSVAENGDAFRQIVYADATDPPRLREATARVAAELASFRPHVVLGETGLGMLITETERLWPPSARFRPYYLDAYLDDPEVVDLVRRHPDARRRIFRIEPPYSSAVLAKLVHRHNEAFAEKITAATAHGAPYDAFYVAAYAIAALGAEPVTGPALARALPRLLPPGEPIDVGPAGIFAALGALGSGRGIDLAGTMTTLDFDLETGDPTADFAVHCLSASADGGAPALAFAGLLFRAKERRLEGRLRCP